MATLNEILSPSVVNRVITRIKTPQSRIQRFLGMNLGGANVNTIGRRYYSWDIFDKTRSIAQMRAPGSGPATAVKQVVGRVSVVFARIHEELRLDYETLHNLRALGRPAGEIDQHGMNYITKQEEYLAQRFANQREFLVSRMLKGSLDVLQDGDNLYPVDAGNGTYSIDYKMPSGNKDQLNMLAAGNIIDGRWDNATTNIYSHLLQINAAFEQLTGRGLKHIWTDSVSWRNVTQNSSIIDVGGTANTVFAQYDQVNEKGPDGMPVNEFFCVLRAIPWLQWHVYDAGLDVATTGGSTSFTKFFNPTNGEVSFLPEVSDDWTEMCLGSEMVIDGPNLPAVERPGFYAWTRTSDKPACIELIGVDNCMPALYVPKAAAYAKTIF